MTWTCACVALALASTGCARHSDDRAAPVRERAPSRMVPVETVSVRDPEIEQRVARLELKLLEREAQVEDLQARLDEARREVVRAMAKLQTLATRAEAASAMAEAEIALEAVRPTAAEPGPDVAQARQLLEMSAAEFNKQNYGGALYLATQAKDLAGVGRTRLGADPGSLRPGEVLFAVPLALQALAPCNVREGPGTSFRVVFTAPRSSSLVGRSYAGEWVRVSDVSGRAGWVHLSLVGRRGGAR